MQYLLLNGISISQLRTPCRHFRRRPPQPMPANTTNAFAGARSTRGQRGRAWCWAAADRPCAPGYPYDAARPTIMPVAVPSLPLAPTPEDANHGGGRR